MLEVGDLITLSDNQEYIVVDTLEYNNNVYVYLIAKNSISIALCRRENDELVVDNDPKIIKMFVDRFKGEKNA